MITYMLYAFEIQITFHYKRDYYYVLVILIGNISLGLIESYFDILYSKF